MNGQNGSSATGIPSTADKSPASNSSFSTAERWVGRTVVVSVSGDLDALTAPDLAAAIQAGARQGPEALIVDLSNVQFLASAGMSVLITADRDLGSSARFGVVADGTSTSRPLKMIGIDTLVAVYRTLDEAVRESTKDAQRKLDTRDGP